MTAATTRPWPAEPAPVPPADLAASIRKAVREAIFPSVEEARKLIGEAGIESARAALGRALDGLEAAQRSYREAQAAEKAAQAEHDEAVLTAEWQLEGRFVREGNKTFLVTTCPTCGGTGKAVADGETCCHVCGGDGDMKRAVLADEARAWKAAEARKLPEVAQARAALRHAEDRTLAARDAVSTAEKRISACTHELDAAVATLHALTAGLAAGRVA